MTDKSNKKKDPKKNRIIKFFQKISEEYLSATKEVNDYQKKTGHYPPFRI